MKRWKGWMENVFVGGRLKREVSSGGWLSSPLEAAVVMACHLSSRMDHFTALPPFHSPQSVLFHSEEVASQPFPGVGLYET